MVVERSPAADADMSGQQTTEELRFLDGSVAVQPYFGAGPKRECEYRYYSNGLSKLQYRYHCQADHECCGNLCCIPSGLPLWAILLIILACLLVLCLILAAIWRFCCRKKAVTPPPSVRRQVLVQQPLPPPPRVEIYKRTPQLSGSLRRISDHNLTEFAHEPGASRTTTYASVRPKSLRTDHEPGSKRRFKSDKHNQYLSTDADGDSSLGDELSSKVGMAAGGGVGGVAAHADANHSGSEPMTLTTPTSNTTLEPAFVPSPMVETYENPPMPIHISYHDESEITQEKRPLLSHVESPGEQKARMAYYRPFIPDPMEVVVLPAPVRQQATYHHFSEISKERYPELSMVELPDVKQAQFIYHIPGRDTVAAY